MITFGVSGFAFEIDWRVDLVSEALGDGTDLKQLMLDGPAEILNKTVNTGPAMLVFSYLEYKKIAENFDTDIFDFEYWFGHSLGEVIAATIAGCFTLPDAIKLSRDRSIIMQNHWPPGLGKMMVWSTNAEKVTEELNKFEEIIAESDLSKKCLQISGINSYSSTSLAGHKEKVDCFIEFLRNQEQHMIFSELAISIAGHWDIMSEAAKEYGNLLSTIDIKDPQIPILSWVDWKLKVTKQEVIGSLVDAFWSPVNFRGWVEHCIDDNIEQYIECSARGSMLKLVKNIKQRYQ